MCAERNEEPNNSSPFIFENLNNNPSSANRNENNPPPNNTRNNNARNNSNNMTDEEIFKWIGIAACILVCPPVGLILLCFKTGDAEEAAAPSLFGGLLVSFLISLVLMWCSGVRINEEPKVTVVQDKASILSFAGRLCSPILWKLSTKYTTNVYQEDPNSGSRIAFYAVGRNIIVFDGSKYVLNFETDRYFARWGEGKKCVDVTRRKMIKCENLLKKALKQGLLPEIEQAKKDLDEAKINLEGVEENYKSVKKDFEVVVEKMNQRYSELNIVLNKETNNSESRVENPEPPLPMPSKDFRRPVLESPVAEPSVETFLEIK